METPNTSTKLHFAALRRVSTEKQEKEGESLRTQRTEITETVKQLNGSIVGWYGGQEHGTPGYEKKEIDRLLSDASKGKFNAVIVNNADRWSRDNKKSDEGLKVFESCGVRFFVGLTEYSLRNPEHKLFLGMSSVIGQFLASNQKRKSIINRIARAKRGIPTVGNLPFARTYDEENGWGIDKKKHENIKEIAKRYLEGESLAVLAPEFKMNLSALHKNLMKRCRDVWEIKFESKDLVIHEVVKMKIPRLLSDETIKAMLEKAAANKTFTHGKIKHDYLLGRMVFCGHCGYAMTGQTNVKDDKAISYYRHTYAKLAKPCPHKKTWLHCDDLDDIVLRYLFEMFGNPKKVQAAIEKAVPNLEKMNQYREQAERIQKEVSSIQTGRERIIRYIAKDTISDKQAEKELNELTAKENKLTEKLVQITNSIDNCPSPKSIEKASKRIANQFGSKTVNVRLMLAKKYANREFDKMTYSEKRAFVKNVFSGKTADGKRMGVYVHWNKDGWKFDIKGQLIDETGLRQLSDEMKDAYFGDFSSAGRHQEDLLTKNVCPLPAITSPYFH